MKAIFLTLGLLVGTVAAYAQPEKLVVVNNSGVELSVTAGIIDPTDCNNAVDLLVMTIPDGQSYTFVPTQDATHEWYGISAVEVQAPGLNPPPAMVRSHSECTTCPPAGNFSNGPTVDWSMDNCQTATIE